MGPNPQIDQATNRFLTSEGYTYDEAGNLKQEPGKSYKYDTENRLTDFNNSSALYSYDGDGRRVKKTVGSEVTVFVYNIAGQLVAEYRNTSVELGGGTSFLTQDHLGSIRMVTHRNGDIKSRHDYLPFGEELSVARAVQSYYLQPDGLNQKFTGKERDSESGLDYFGARYYSSTTGRFTSADSYTGSPQMPQTFNLYSYTINNPLRYTDPTGNFIVSKSPLDGMDPLDPAVGEEGGSLSPITDAAIATMAQQQQSLAGRTYLLVVGDPGLGDHNVGDNFQRAADTKRAEIEGKGATVISKRISNVDDLSEALVSNGILNGVEFFGHATFDALFIGETDGVGTNLDHSNLSLLSNANLAPGAYVSLHACFASARGADSIGYGIARQLSVPVYAYDGPTRFSTNPQLPDGRKFPPSSGPIYMVPDPGVKLRLYQTRPRR